jgi:Transposase
MQIMNEDARRVIGGVDAHADTHHAAALDERGALLETKSFPVSAGGYRELLAWLRSFGEIERIGVESTGSYGAGLTRYLVGEGALVIEVNQPHPHTRRRRGKTDAIDAEPAARHALARPTPVIPKQTTGIVESIRQLRVARESAVKSRSAAVLQLGDLILTAPSELREQLAAPKTLKGKAGLAGDCAQITVVWRIRSTPQSSRCAALPGASCLWTARSPTGSSSPWSRAPPPGPPPCSGSPQGTPDNSCSPPAKTSSGCAVRPRLPRSAAPAPSQSPQASVAATA